MPFSSPGLYGFPTNYQPATKPDDPPPIAEARLKAARPLAEYISRDGGAIYRKRYGRWQQADWLAKSSEWGAWWEIAGEPPVDKVKL